MIYLKGKKKRGRAGGAEGKMEGRKGVSERGREGGRKERKKRQREGKGMKGKESVHNSQDVRSPFFSISDCKNNNFYAKQSFLIAYLD